MTEQAYNVSSTFCQEKIIRASSEARAVGKYVEQYEDSGRSYPEESAIKVVQVRSKTATLFVCVDGHFERE